MDHVSHGAEAYDEQTLIFFSAYRCFRVYRCAQAFLGLRGDDRRERMISLVE
jgi:hypothetical protein